MHAAVEPDAHDDVLIGQPLGPPVVLFAKTPLAVAFLLATVLQQLHAGDTTIVTGGVAQLLFSGVPVPNGYEVTNPDPSEACWVSDTGTAAPNAKGSTLVPALGFYDTPPGFQPGSVVSIYCATTGHQITARGW